MNQLVEEAGDSMAESGASRDAMGTKQPRGREKDLAGREKTHDIVSWSNLEEFWLKILVFFGTHSHINTPSCAQRFVMELGEGRGSAESELEFPLMNLVYMGQYRLFTSFRYKISRCACCAARLENHVCPNMLCPCTCTIVCRIF